MATAEALERAEEAPQAPAVVAEGVELVYETGDGPVTALEDIDLAIFRGEFVSLIGPSGCGKTTLLRIIADLVRPTGGRIAVNVANLGRRPYRSLSADVIRILEHDLGLLLRGELVWQKGEGANAPARRAGAAAKSSRAPKRAPSRKAPAA